MSDIIQSNVFLINVITSCKCTFPDKINSFYIHTLNVEFCKIINIRSIAEAYLELSRTSTIEFFAKIVNGF